MNPLSVILDAVLLMSLLKSVLGVMTDIDLVLGVASICVYHSGPVQ